MRSKRNWLLWLVMGGFLALAQNQLWGSRDGFPADAGLARAIVRQRRINRRLEETNRMLYAEVESLEKGTGAVAQQARTDLDFIRPGETFYEIVERKRSPAPRPPPGVPGRPAPTDRGPA
jgi:cell division protein FtsB